METIDILNEQWKLWLGNFRTNEDFILETS